MIAALWTVASLAGLVLGVGGAFLAVMNAKRMQQDGTLTWFWRVIALVWAVPGTILDIVFQWTLGNMFAERPPVSIETVAWLGRTFRIPVPELMFSSRVQRHVDESPRGWRLALAIWWAKQLNAGDPRHIRRVYSAISRQRGQAAGGAPS